MTGRRVAPAEPGPVAYYGLAGEYEVLLGPLAEQTWRRGILAEVAQLGLPAGIVVVDLGAGTGVGGRLLPTVLAAPHRIGVDSSARMLAQAGQWYERTKVADLRRLPLPSGSAPLLVSGFDTLNYLDAGALTGCFREAARCLMAGGWLVFDYSSPQLLRGTWFDHTEEQPAPDGGVVTWRYRFDPHAQRCVSTAERRDRSGALRWRETHVQYALDAYEVHTVAASAGLAVVQVRDLDRTEFSPGAHTHVWALRRKAA